MDLTQCRYDTFEELRQYCYRVASVVGLVCIRIFGFTDGAGANLPPGAEQHAEELGIAFQLTNILRDIPEDAAMGRIYLPLEDLAAFQYPEADLLAGVVDDRFLRLVRFEAERARHYYDRARPLLGMIHPSSRPCLAAMYGIYRGILNRIEGQGYNVFAARARLSTWRKLGVAASSWVRYGLVAR
jgi:phytoene synthase